MGEAKRRAAARAAEPPIPDNIPEDIRTDIAAAVRSVTVFTPGGQCWLRALTGMSLLRTLGLASARIALGGMAYRTGPDEERDVLAYCGPGNCGYLRNGTFLGHVWIKCRDDLIDFSVGDWRRESITAGVPPETQAELGWPGKTETDLGAIQWTAPPLPEFHWQPWSSLVWDSTTHPDRHRSTPEVGEAWYGPFAGQYPDIREIAEPVLPMAKIAYREIEANAKALRLAERLRASAVDHVAFSPNPKQGYTPLCSTTT